MTMQERVTALEATAFRYGAAIMALEANFQEIREQLAELTAAQTSPVAPDSTVEAPV